MIRSFIFTIIIPHGLIVSVLNNTFLLFLRTAERFREDYDIAVAMLAPPQVAARYGYELRVFDEAGFAYRGPMLSVVVKREQFWTQVCYYFEYEAFMAAFSGISSAYSKLRCSGQLF